MFPPRYWRRLVLVVALAVQVTSGFDLLILHTNDFHDRIEETNKYSGSCSSSDSAAGKCFGGVARLTSKVKELRGMYSNSLLLDAGDQYQGTLWFFKFGGALVAQFMNMVGYDAMSLGNHEFDNGVAGLVPLADNVSFPLLSANIDLSTTPVLQGQIYKSTILTVGGESIGIIGYTTSDTPYISNPGTVTFGDERTAVQIEADQLTSAGVNKIIALGHAGYVEDVKMARQLRGVDLIIGGHSNTFLYNGDKPSNEDPIGAYPTVVTNPSTGEDVLVVQSYAYGKYLGRLHVTFDDQGHVTNYNGNPVLLDATVQKDSTVDQSVQSYLPQVEALESEKIGDSHVFLNGDRYTCRIRECNLGNLITDAMLKQNLRHSDSRYWSDVSIAVLNSGAMRASIPKGSITIGDVIRAQPFRNAVDIVELRGSTILKILEHGASFWTTGPDLYGGFLQVSGLRIVYDMTAPEGSRVVDVQARCAKCDIPQFLPLDVDEVYQVVMTAFIAGGGDKYTFIPNEKIRRHVIGNIDVDILRDYIADTTPITQGLEGRIRFLQEIQNGTLWQTISANMPCSGKTESCTPDSCSYLASNIFVIFFALLIVALKDLVVVARD